jgi:hypothetical protein
LAQGLSLWDLQARSPVEGGDLAGTGDSDFV